MKYLLALLLVFNTICAWAQKDKKLNAQHVKSENEDHRFVFSIGGLYLSVPATENSESDLSGPGVSVGFRYALWDKWGVGANYEQAFETSGASVTTSFSTHLTYALTGILAKKTTSTAVDGKKVMELDYAENYGFRLQLLFVQHYLNASNGAIPFNGAGIAAYYDFSPSQNWNWNIGLRYDQAVNQDISITPMMFIGGVSFWY